MLPRLAVNLIDAMHSCQRAPTAQIFDLQTRQRRVKEIGHQFHQVSVESHSIMQSCSKYNRVADKFKKRSTRLVNGNSKSFNRMQKRIKHLTDIDIGDKTEMEKDPLFDQMF